MLVFSRKPAQAIRVGEIRILVTAIQGNTVRLGIDAPTDVPVHREEVFRAIRRDGRTHKVPAVRHSFRLSGIVPQATDAMLRRDGLLPSATTRSNQRDQEESD